MTPFGKPVVPDVYCMLQTSLTSTAAAILVISSIGVLDAYSSDSSHVSAPGMRKPQVMTLRRNGSLLQCSGWPGLLSFISGQSSFMISS